MPHSRRNGRWTASTRTRECRERCRLLKGQDSAPYSITFAKETRCTCAVDRLGRDAIDIQSTIRELISKGVTVEIRGLGQIAKGVGELIIAVLAQVADMKRQRIRERTSSGRELARATLAATGKTHRGKESLGRPYRGDAGAVRVWRDKHSASIKETAEQFNLSTSTVKRYCAT